MKIGIVSFYDTQQNYGQILQCYALQTFLSRLGHEVFHLRHNDAAASTSLANKLKKLASSILHGDFGDLLKLRQSNIQNPPKESIFQRHAGSYERGFDNFRNNYIALSDHEYTMNDLDIASPSVDAWITGSDQVWGSGPTRLYHLQFGDKKTKRIAYAASMGGFKLDNKYQRRYFKKYLKSFDYISLRESDGVDECRNLGFKDAKLALDPTFILSADDYRRISKTPNNKPRSPYILLYLLGSPISLGVDVIFDWALTKNLDVCYIASQGREDGYSKFEPCPEEWMWLIDNAEYIITNSFHGMAFSIIFRKKFLVLPIIGRWSRMNSRINTTLEVLKLPTSRVYAGCLDDVTIEINYSMIDVILQDKIKEIKSDLSTILR